MAAELKEDMGLQSELVEKGGGVFEIYLDDQIVYSKSETGRFPSEGEVLALLKEKQA